MLIARLLREISFHAVEQLVTRAADLCVRSLLAMIVGYFTNVGPGRYAAGLIGAHRAKRNKPSRIRVRWPGHRCTTADTHSPRLRVLPSAAHAKKK